MRAEKRAEDRAEGERMKAMCPEETTVTFFNLD